MRPDGSRRRRLTNAEGNDFTPRWSPDGSRIAFRSTRDGNDEIYVMDADGGGETNLTRTAFEERSPDWSLDGTRILFDGRGDVEVMRSDGSGRRRLSRGDHVDTNPSWSPDGRWIVFARGPRRRGDRLFARLFVMTSTGRRVKPVSPRGWGDVQPAWRP